MAPAVSVVTPIYNEESNLDELVRRCVDTLRATGREWELILVDDGSRDRSAELIEDAVHANGGPVRGIVLDGNHGQFTALVAGFREARGDVVITLDADLQNPPEEIPRLLAKSDEGHDLVGTVRVDRQDSVFRRLVSLAPNALIRLTTGKRAMRDHGSALRAYGRSVVDGMLAASVSRPYLPVLAYRWARSCHEIDVGHAARRAGESKYGLLSLMRLQLDVLRSSFARRGEVSIAVRRRLEAVAAGGEKPTMAEPSREVGQGAED